MANEHLLDDTSAQAEIDAAGGLDRRRFLGGVGAATGAAALAMALPGTAFAEEQVPAGAGQFIGFTPFRVLDTRTSGKYPVERINGRHVRMNLRGYTDPGTQQQIDPEATSVVLNVTIVNGTDVSTNNVVSVVPAGNSADNPLSIMNPFLPVAVAANMVTVKFSNSGQIDVTLLRDAKIVVDVLGCYKPVTGPVPDGRLRPRSPLRIWDSRIKGGRLSDYGSIEIDVTSVTSEDSSAIVFNLTGVNSDGRGHVAALPAWSTGEPSTSTLNFSHPGDTVAGSAIVPIRTEGGRRAVRIWARSGCDFIIDVTGQFTGPDSEPSTDGLFVALNPERILDTRGLWPNKIGPRRGRLWDNWVVEARVTNHSQVDQSVMGRVGAIAVNVSAIFTRPYPANGDRGHLTLSAAGLPEPTSSTLNWTVPNGFAANHAISTVTWDGVQARTISGAGVLIDLAGYFLGRPSVRQTPELGPNQIPPSAPPPWKGNVPNLYSSAYNAYGITKNVLPGPDGDPIIDAGNIWHWTNTGALLDNRRVILMGHRTSADGVYRNIHKLPMGSLAHLDTQDGRRYTFRYIAKQLSGTKSNDILAACQRFPAPSLHLVACTAGHARPGKQWDEPTSLDWRIVCSFEFVEWSVIWE